MNYEMSLLDRFRCGVSIDDPLFEPFQAEEQDNSAPGAGSGQGQAQNSTAPWGSGIASNATGIAGNQNYGTIIIIKSPIGELVVVGPFQNEDEAFDYVKKNRVSDDFWFRVTELEPPY